jgi:type III secretion system FlhB-like substrate exporter
MTTQKVVGVSFAEDATVPTVVLKAAGEDAANVVTQAQAEGRVPLVRLPQLADALYRTPIDAPIDKELFPVMAALLVHVMQSDRLLKEKKE